MFYRLVIAFVLFCVSSMASTDIRDLDSFKASFVQVITSNSQNKIEYKGDVFIKKSGKILWKYKTPVVKNVYINNDYAVVDEPELEQAIYTKLESEINIIKLLNNSKKVNENSYTTNIDDVDYLIKTSKDDNKISYIKYKDKLENDVEIKFSSVVQNGDIQDEMFKFTPPSNYDIIRSALQYPIIFDITIWLSNYDFEQVSQKRMVRSVVLGGDFFVEKMAYNVNTGNAVLTLIKKW